jgi:hypothetical protein
MPLSDVAYFTAFIGSALLGTIGIRIDEEPAHERIARAGPIEVRRYFAHATATVPLGQDEGEAFKRLAGYILGRNRGKKRIAMTAPVVMPSTFNRIAMTAPVETGNSQMSFSMPRAFKLDDLPEPIDPGIQLTTTPERIVATIRFRGSAPIDIRSKKEEELRKWLTLNGWKALSAAKFAAYDPPFTLPFLKRNEVHIEVERADIPR